MDNGLILEQLEFINKTLKNANDIELYKLGLISENVLKMRLGVI